MSDERKGLPSASEYHRIVGCPGYLNAKAKLPADIPKETSAEAESGTKIAAVLESELLLPTLTDEEFLTYEKLKHGRSNIVRAVFGDEPVKFNRIDSEKRLWLGDYFSGKPDVVFYKGNTALIIDDKSGRNEVAQAAGNMQLRALAVLCAWDFPGIERVVVAINQPWASPAYSLAEYDDTALDLAEFELDRNLERAKTATKLCPGSHCAYCPCESRCPKKMNNLIETVSLHPALTTATDEHLAAFLDWVDTHDPVSTIDSVKKEVKRRIAAGVPVKGWTLKPGRITETITDPETVFTRCGLNGVTYQDFMKSVKIGKDALKDALESATGKKGKALADLLDEVIAGAVTESQSEPSLVREKKELT